MLAGEYLADSLPGFGPATPLALADAGNHGSILVYATTNGTVALNNAVGAAHVYVGALLNGAVLATHVARTHPDTLRAAGVLGFGGSVQSRRLLWRGHIGLRIFARRGSYTLTGRSAGGGTFIPGLRRADRALGASRVGRMMQAH